MADLIDVHAHFLTERYVAEASRSGHALPDGMPAWPTWSAERHLRLMDDNGIAKAVLSVSSPGVHLGDDTAAAELARHVNDSAAEVAARFPGRFGSFAALPLPDVGAALAELARALDELGADGVALESNVEGRYLGDPLFTPLLEELDRRGAVAFVHPTSPRGWEAVSPDRPRPMLEFPFDTTRTVADLLFSGALERFPGIGFVIPHCGGTLALLADRIELFRTTFTSGGGAPTRDQLRGLWFDLAGTPFPAQVPALASVVGTGKLLYGSDFCFTPPEAVARQLASIDGAPGADWRELTTRNAERLLGR
ncbi:amidohydrolase family protein [Umezawaea sp.]|uniref:amidohydrolase family protein n=1 Tax=Umezawaea sp. TaxID=1955258 RepID=UPI002ED48661